jgi:KUP system potassium uptake protein
MPYFINMRERERFTPFPVAAPLFWPTFIIAIFAAIIASQAMLSGAFAILSKALSLGCLPRVQVIHTSKKYEGQVYIPEVNFMMGLASIIVTIGFRTTTSIGNAYGKKFLYLSLFRGQNIDQN